MPLPQYVEVLNVSSAPVTVRDEGLAASGGMLVIPADRKLHTIPRMVWRRRRRRYADRLCERDRAERLGLLAAPAVRVRRKKDEEANESE